MKKILIRAYMKKNLGDDIFAKILLERYPNEKFYICSTESYRNTLNHQYKNVKFINHNIVKILNKINSTLKIDKFNIENIIKKRTELMINLGGSMFMQSIDINREKKRISRIYNKENKKYYILGSNFGPYKDKEYKDCYKKVFEKAEDVCFREKYSYDIFKELPNVRYTTDMVFGLNTKNIRNINSKKVIISVIECEKRFSKEIKEKYEEKIREISNYYISIGYEVILMSFCKKEGDEKAIESIISKISEINRSKVKKYYYKGNIDEALNIIGDSSIVIATRFHATILGLLLQKKVIPIIYSNKTLNILNDMNFDDEYVKIENIEGFNIKNINLEKIYKINVEEQREKAQEYFIKLDKEILGENNGKETN